MEQLDKKIQDARRERLPYLSGWIDKKVYLHLLQLALAKGSPEIQVSYSSLASSVELPEFMLIQACRRLQRKKRIKLLLHRLGNDHALQTIRVL